MSRLTRRQLAKYVATQLAIGEVSVIDELAAYLLHEHRVKELDLLVRDIEAALLEGGVGVAHIVSAKPLDATLRHKLTKLLQRELNVTKIHIDEALDPSLLGGFTAAAAGQELDASLIHKINQLKTMKA